MARELVSDALWKRVRKFIPSEAAKPAGGRPRASARSCLVGILYILRTGSAWNTMPAELSSAAPTTCWRRHKEWVDAGVWDQIWRAALAFLNRKGEVDLSVAIADSASVRAALGGSTRVRIRPTAASAAASGT